MKRIMLLAGMVGVLSIVALALAETNEPDGPKDMAGQVNALQNELNSLQSRLAKLEKQVSELANLMKVYPARGVEGLEALPIQWPDILRRTRERKGCDARLAGKITPVCVFANPLANAATRLIAISRFRLGLRSRRALPPSTRGQPEGGFRNAI